MGRLTRPQIELLTSLAEGNCLIHSPDGDDAWLSPDGRYLDDIFVTPEDLSFLRRLGLIASDEMQPAEGRFSAPEVITEAGRRALAQEQG